MRRFPLFAMFGDGRYHIQPVHVDDLAGLMVEQGLGSENSVVNALGQRYHGELPRRTDRAKAY